MRVRGTVLLKMFQCVMLVISDPRERTAFFQRTTRSGSACAEIHADADKIKAT